MSDKGGIDMERTTLYCAANSDGKEARKLLDQAGIDYELHLWPDQVTSYKLPILESPFGVYRGLEEIEKFADSRLAKRFLKV
jgi:hypothetical protein